jgi:6-phosphofructo-2-kinase/fructose-2,6-biphosphatase 4
MRWLGVATKVFSVGNYRRERLGSLSEDWFDPSNKKMKMVVWKIELICVLIR